MERAVRRLEIFQDDFDKVVFLEILRGELNKNDCKLHAYCLMSNHFHFLLETDETEIGKFMKGLACKYAMQYNHRYSYTQGGSPNKLQALKLLMEEMQRKCIGNILD